MGHFFTQKNTCRVIKYVKNIYENCINAVKWCVYKIKSFGSLIETELWYPFRNREFTFLNIEIHSFILTTCLDKELIVNEFSPSSSKCTIWHVWHISTECLKRNLRSHLPNTEEKTFHSDPSEGSGDEKSFSRLFQTVPADDATLSHFIEKKLQSKTKISFILTNN